MKIHFVACKHDVFPTVSTKRAIPSLGQGPVAKTAVLSLRRHVPLSLIDHAFGRIGRHWAGWFEPELVAMVVSRHYIRKGKRFLVAGCSFEP